MNLVKFTFGALAAVSMCVAAGCQESTTQKDVAKAKQNYNEEKVKTQETVRDAQEDVAQAQRDAQNDANRTTVNKPVIDSDTMTDAQRSVANAARKGEERIVDQKQDEREAALKLEKTKRDFEATQARNAFAGQAEQELAKADQMIDQLEQRAKTLDGAVKDAFEKNLKGIKTERDSLKSSLSDLKKAELDKWDIHKQAVESAMRDLTRDLNAVK